jgi:hypothetical protein
MRPYVCQCGGVIVGPRPHHCPHCGAKIKRFRQRVNVWPLVIIAVLFAAVLAFLFWLVNPGR